MHEYKEAVIKWIENHKDEFMEIADYLFDHPELGLEEYEASHILTAVLQRYGFQVESNIAGMPTAFIAAYGNTKPVIGFNAEYDCLPGLSQRPLSIKKEPIMEGAPGHGCGHNILGTAEVLGAIALRYTLEENNLPGTIKVFGSPAEELCIGKPFMAGEGCYKGIDCFLDWHPWNYNKAHYDTCSAYFNVKYHFKGETAHGNSPWLGRSAFDAAMLTGHAIELLREHYEPAAADRANTINYTFSDTGPAFPSVVPDKTTLWCIGRFTNSELMKKILTRIDKCAKAGALATETKVEREFITATHEKIPNKVLAKMVYDNFLELGAVPFTDKEQELAMQMEAGQGIKPKGLDTHIMDFGTSGTALCDTSEFSWHAPYATFWMTAAPGGSWHNWKVASCVGGSIGHKTMIHAAKLLAISGIDVILNPEILIVAKNEWKERLGGRKYKSLLPKDVKVPLGINGETMQKYKDKGKKFNDTTADAVNKEDLPC